MRGQSVGLISNRQSIHQSPKPQSLITLAASPVYRRFSNHTESMKSKVLRPRPMTTRRVLGCFRAEIKRLRLHNNVLTWSLHGLNTTRILFRSRKLKSSIIYSSIVSRKQIENLKNNLKMAFRSLQEISIFLGETEET